MSKNKSWEPEDSRPGDPLAGLGGLGGPGGPARVGAIRHLRGAWSTGGGKIFVTFCFAVTLAAGIAIGRVVVPDKAAAVQTGAAAGTVPGAVQTTASGVGVGDGAQGAGVTPAAPGGDGSGPTGPTVGPSGIGTVSVVNMTPASGAFNSGDASPMLNGKPQLLSLTSSVGGCYGATSGDAQYNLSRDYTVFSALTGIDDNSASSTLEPTIEIDGDGLKLAVYTPTLGHPIQITVDVSGVLRLDVKWTDPAAGCGMSGTLVFGDAQLTTIAGYRPPAPTAPTG